MSLCLVSTRFLLLVFVDQDVSLSLDAYSLGSRLREAALDSSDAAENGPPWRYEARLAWARTS